MVSILVVEDDVHVRTFLRGLLEKEGHRVLEAGEGAEALNVVSQESIECVITDILMPGIEGIELIRYLRHEQPDIKIIAISGGGRVDASQYLHMAEDLGADRVIIKPFDPQQVLDTVDVLFWNRQNAALPA
jgi:CheY-like chemotaxis protein